MKPINEQFKSFQEFRTDLLKHIRMAYIKMWLIGQAWRLEYVFIRVWQGMNTTIAFKQLDKVTKADFENLKKNFNEKNPDQSRL